MSRAQARYAAGKRRLFMRLGIGALAIAIFALVPGYYATQPQFLQRYSHLSGPYQTWSGSVHANVKCQSCHVPPDRSSQVLYDARMLGEFYLSLVAPSRTPNVLGEPTNEACQSCHIDLRTVSPAGDLNIPHRAHVDVLKLRCVQCHKYLVHETNPEGTHTPRMALCLTCHNGKTAKNDCSACHTNKRMPESHRQANWLVIHPTMQQAIDCTKCHQWTSNWCAACHASRPRSHTATWRTDHRLKVATHRNCEACHDAAFCTRCHGEVPSLNFNPALKLVR